MTGYADYRAELSDAWRAHQAPRTADAPTVVSLFAGAGGSSLGYSMAGFRELLAVEWDAHAAACLRRNFPHVPIHHGDVAAVGPDAIDLPPGTLDVLDGSPPCFNGAMLVTSVKGQVPISDLRVGDLVLTHRGRWRPVVAIGSKIADTVMLRGQGHPAFEATANHPIYSRERLPRGKGWTAPVWTPAADMQGRFWAVPARIDPLPIPPVGGRGVEFTPEFWWMVGRWLGDGWVRLRGHHGNDDPAKTKEPLRAHPAVCVRCDQPALRHARYPARATAYCSPECNRAGKRERTEARGASMGDSLLICCSFREADEVRARLAKISPAAGRRAGPGELRWRDHRERTAQRFECHHNGLAAWLVEHFGRGAANKQVPAWALGMPTEHRRALLDGLLSADGCTRANGQHRVTTISTPLAFSLRMLVESLGGTTTVHWSDLPPTTSIDGRTVRQTGFYQVSWFDRTTKHVHRDDVHTWGLVRAITPGVANQTVWNIEVAEDHSYVIDGVVVVHNCQGFSPIGGRRLNDPRNQLFRHYVRLLRAWRPRALVMENVPGMTIGKMRPLFGEIMEELRNAGYRLTVRELVASYYRVPQRRKRIVFIGVRDDLATIPTHPVPISRELTFTEAVADLGTNVGLVRQAAGTYGALMGHMRQGENGSKVLQRAGKKPSFYAATRLRANAPSPTVLKDSGAHLIHPTKHRMLGTRELSRVCSFPDDYDWGPSTYGQIQARLGNSVPPLLMRAIARHLRATILDGVS